MNLFKVPVADSPRKRLIRSESSPSLALALVLCATALAGACNNDSPVAPSSSVQTIGRSVTATGSSATPAETMNNAAMRLSATSTLPVGSTNVPAVSGSLCGYTSDNPFSCCQNSVSLAYYGNCTGGAWQKAKEAGWGNGLPKLGWGNANNWANAARADGHLVDPAPSRSSIGVANNGPKLKDHVAFVLDFNGGSQVTTIDQQCGYLYRGDFLQNTRDVTAFNAGYIRAPIPTVELLLWTGALTATNGGSLTVAHGTSVGFGFGLLRSNVNNAIVGPSSFRWTIAGAPVSTEGTFSRTFVTAGTFPVAAVVTNGLKVSTTVTANIVVR